MFVNPKELKKLMQEAYKSNNLIVGNTGESYYLQGIYWKVLCKKGFITKTILAEIVELAGELPEEGECFCAGKDGNQMQVNPMKIEKDMDPTKVAVTNMVMLEHSAARLLQSNTGKIFLINNRLVNMVTGHHCDEANGETEPVGPYIVGTSQAYWKNNVMEFITVLRGTDSYERMLEQMEMVDMTEHSIW